MAKKIDVKKLRNQLNMSMSDLAKEAGVNLSTVWRWENEGVPENGPARAFLDALSQRAASAA